ncbi:hypothetical protein [Aneurinibacillus aneurinilyticus]|uniref:hypothetical protein n=1 Tax=Aneurinibacillus aneurinilyticus TaxID=1391 RepID=UPI0023F1CB77|nr:hypothetical protein [Aneurinibacillus aneurinilyticus]
MKIIVQNEKEKDLIKRFVDLLTEYYGLDALEIHDDEMSKYPDEIPRLNADEYKLLYEEFRDRSITIDENIEEMLFENDDVITGTCKVCGIQTCGRVNGESVTYSDYLHSMSKEQQDKWLCLTCYEKQQETPA